MKEATAGRPEVALRTRPAYRPAVEVVERKGTGHPDTLCDHLAEALCLRLSGAFVARTGQLQHFNVDKALLVAGEVEVDYGGGRHVAPAELILAGRAGLARFGIEPDGLVTALQGDLAVLLPEAQPDAFRVQLRLRPPSGQLEILTSAERAGPPLANDTSYAVVSLPRSPLEELVYRAERHLNSPAFRGVAPIGRDIKVAGARVGNAVELIVAAAILAGPVKNRHDYDAAVTTIRDETMELARQQFGPDVAVSVNGAGTQPYLTLSGTSGEAGDDGQVGRGNRFGGLITPLRPTSIEACAGKNPLSHIGKTYHCVAFDIARRLLAETTAAEATVGLQSHIGDPVDSPRVIHIETAPATNPSQVSAIVHGCLADWEGVRDRLLAGAYELF